MAATPSGKKLADAIVLFGATGDLSHRMVLPSLFFLDADDRLTSELHGLEGLAVAPDGSMVYVADGTRGEEGPFNRIRQINMAP